MSRILVFGAGGMLGHKLCQMLPPAGHEVIGAVRGDPHRLTPFGEIYHHTRLLGGVDVLDDALLEKTVREVKPDAIVNCIGIVKQLRQAEDRFLSVAINSFLPHKLARLAATYGARLIHISTDCVFSGQRGNYAEADPSDAQDIYGKSKFLGETSDDEPAAVTLRTSFIGPELTRPTHGLVEWFMAQQGKTVKGFSRAIYTGFTSIELCKIIAMLIYKRPAMQGLYQVASAPIDKFALLNLIKGAYGLHTDIEREGGFVCDRSMSGARFCDATGYTAPSWKTMIEQMREDSTPYTRWFTRA